MRSSSLVFYTHDGHQNHIVRHPQLEVVSTCDRSSNSVIISLASFMVWKFPTLDIPNSLNIVDQPQYGLTFPNYFCAFHKLYSLWIEQLCDALEEGHAIRKQDHCYFRIKVNSDYANRLLQLGFKQSKYQGLLTWSQIYNNVQQPQGNKPLILFLSCSPNVRAETTKISLKGLYLGIYFNNERWKSYRIMLQQRPTQEQYEKAALIIIPGSSISVTKEFEEISAFKKELRKYVQNKSKKILGVCYGHQLLADVMGGVVKKSQSPCYELEKIQINHKSKLLETLDFLAPLRNQSSLIVTEYHSDEIAVLPPDFEVVVSSEDCVNQVVASENGNFLGIQCHPEYSSGYTRSLGFVWRTPHLSLQDINKYKQQQFEIRDRNLPLREVIKLFIASAKL